MINIKKFGTILRLVYISALLTGCAPNMLHVMIPLDKNPSVAVVYKPTKLQAAIHPSRPFLEKLIFKNEETDMPGEFADAAEIFVKILKNEYPLNNIRLVDEVEADKCDYIIFFNLDSSYTDDSKKNATKLNFMVTIQMVESRTKKQVTQGIITAFSEVTEGIYEKLAELLDVLPPAQALHKLRGRVERGTRKWMRQVKGSVKFLESSTNE